MALEVKLWKGAVEPAVLNPINLQVALWKGAVEPGEPPPPSGLPVGHRSRSPRSQGRSTTIPPRTSSSKVAV